MSKHDQPTHPPTERGTVEAGQVRQRLNEAHQPMAKGESPSKPPDNPPNRGPVEDG